MVPGANRARVIGMFENIGRLSTRWVSNRAADFSDVVSSRGDSALTTISSLTWPMSRVNGTVSCSPTPSVMRSRTAALKPGICTLTA